jgi:hypothetical protein
MANGGDNNAGEARCAGFRHGLHPRYTITNGGTWTTAARQPRRRHRLTTTMRHRSGNRRCNRRETSHQQAPPPTAPTPLHSPSTQEQLQDRLVRLMGDVRQAINAPPQPPTSAPAPSEHSMLSSTHQRFNEWLRERMHVDPLGPVTSGVSEAQSSRAASPTCSIRSVSTSDPTPPVRRHGQRASISLEDTLFNLGCHLRAKEITIRLTPDGSILFEHDNNVPFYPPQYVTQLKFQPPPVDLPLSEDAYATDISFIAT